MIFSCLRFWTVWHLSNEDERASNIRLGIEPSPEFGSWVHYMYSSTMQLPCVSELSWISYWSFGGVKAGLWQEQRSVPFKVKYHDQPYFALWWLLAWSFNPWPLVGSSGWLVGMFEISRFTSEIFTALHCRMINSLGFNPWPQVPEQLPVMFEISLILFCYLSRVDSRRKDQLLLRCPRHLQVAIPEINHLRASEGMHQNSIFYMSKLILVYTLSTILCKTLTV